jgi:hypothetical protein
MRFKSLEKLKRWILTPLAQDYMTPRPLPVDYASWDSWDRDYYHQRMAESHWIRIWHKKRGYPNLVAALDKFPYADFSWDKPDEDREEFARKCFLEVAGIIHEKSFVIEHKNCHSRYGCSLLKLLKDEYGFSIHSFL